jgi:hypothetical protein
MRIENPTPHPRICQRAPNTANAPHQLEMRRTNRYVRGPVKGIFRTKDPRSAQGAQMREFDLQFQATGISMFVRIGRSVDLLQRRIR